MKEWWWCRKYWLWSQVKSKFESWVYYKLWDLYHLWAIVSSCVKKDFFKCHMLKIVSFTFINRLQCSKSTLLLIAGIPVIFPEVPLIKCFWECESLLMAANQMMPLAGLQNCWPLKRPWYLLVLEAVVVLLLPALPLRQAATYSDALSEDLHYVSRKKECQEWIL